MSKVSSRNREVEQVLLLMAADARAYLCLASAYNTITYPVELSQVMMLMTATPEPCEASVENPCTPIHVMLGSVRSSLGLHHVIATRGEAPFAQKANSAHR